MSPSTSASALKFLLDENVRFELLAFLESKGIGVKVVPKGSPDERVASLSKREKRVLVTNDGDFTEPGLYSKEKLFALVWLRIDQGDSEGLVDSFESFLSKFNVG